MILPLGKLLTYEGNKYILTRASMEAVDKISNMKTYPEDGTSWKIVPNILKLVLDEEVNYEYKDGFENTEDHPSDE